MIVTPETSIALIIFNMVLESDMLKFHRQLFNIKNFSTTDHDFSIKTKTFPTFNSKINC